MIRARSRIPAVIDGEPTWVFDGHPMGRASAGAVIGRALYEGGFTLADAVKIATA